MNLHENIKRIKEVMGLITEEENEPVKKGINHGKVIIQPYHEGQKDKKLDSFIIGITHFDENNPVYLEKNDINPSIINKIIEVAQQCGYFYEGIGGPDLKNIERFFKEELGLNDIKDNKSYEPKISQEDKSKKDLQKSDLLEIPFYHGTTLESWKTDESNDSYLFIIDEIEVAKNHALDRIESRDSNDKTAIVLQINIKDVIDLKWVEDDDLGTWPYKSWQESWKEVGSFAIVGNIPDKKFKTIWSKTF